MFFKSLCILVHFEESSLSIGRVNSNVPVKCQPMIISNSRSDRTSEYIVNVIKCIKTFFS